MMKFRMSRDCLYVRVDEISKNVGKIYIKIP